MLSSSLLPLALAAALAAPVGGPVPAYPAEVPPPPQVSAAEWIVYDATADVVLASWNAHDRRPMASVTKIMTAVVVLDEVGLDEVVTVPGFATRTRGSKAGLVAGERLTVNDLLVSMLVRSGNDAALTLAWYVGDGSVERFVSLMNAKARALGMQDTHFANPNGLDRDGHYTTASDLITLMKTAVRFPDIRRITSIKLVKTPADRTGLSRHFTNTNRLLGAYPGVVGMKTGDTPQAGKVLLALAERGPRTLMTVVMGSEDHFADTRELLDWGFATYGVADRLLRPLYAEEGGGGLPAVGLELGEGRRRRLAAMPRLDDGRWRMSAIAELPKGRRIGEWLRDTLPGALGGAGGTEDGG